MHFISLFILSPLFYFWNDKIRTRSCSADLNFFTFLSKRQIRRQLAKPLHRIFSASPHSHDGATHGVTHGHRKYHHQLHVIRRLTTLPTLLYGVNNIAPAHLPLLLSRPLIPAYSPFGSSHTERIWCLIHLLKVLCRPEETPLLEGAPSDLQSKITVSMHLQEDQRYDHTSEKSEALTYDGYSAKCQGPLQLPYSLGHQ